MHVETLKTVEHIGNRGCLPGLLYVVYAVTAPNPQTINQRLKFHQMGWGVIFVLEPNENSIEQLAWVQGQDFEGAGGTLTVLRRPSLDNDSMVSHTSHTTSM